MRYGRWKWGRVDGVDSPRWRLDSSERERERERESETEILLVIVVSNLFGAVRN